MNIEEYYIRDFLQSYEINQDIKDISWLYEGYEESIPPRVKVIAKAELADKSQYVVKCILEEEHPEALIEEQSCFSECLRKNGINTAKRLKYGDRYCMSYTIDRLTFVVTLEEYLGEEIRFINFDTVNEIAVLMATMHKIAERNNCHINKNTIRKS